MPLRERGGLGRVLQGRGGVEGTPAAYCWSNLPPPLPARLHLLVTRYLMQIQRKGEGGGERKRGIERE